MTNEIIERFEQIKSTLQNPIGYIRTEVSKNGEISYKTGRFVSVIMWLFVLFLCIAFFINGIEPNAPQNIFSYIFLGASGILAVLLLIWLPYLFSPLPYFTINTDLRTITLHAGFPVWRAKENIPIDDIKLFLSYSCHWTDNVESACYLLLENGQIYPLIGRLGSVSPDNITKSLGYMCRKSVVKITEKEPLLGPLAWNGPSLKPKRGDFIKIDSFSEIWEVLYDPDVGTDTQQCRTANDAF